MMKAAFVMLAAVALGLASCSQPSAPDPQVASLKARLDILEARVGKLEGKQEAQAIVAQPTTVTLTETWLVPDQQPHTTQAKFTSLQACEQARQAAMAEFERANARDREAPPDQPGVAHFGPPIGPQPRLQALCSE
jgi:hypothetical protein